MSIHIPDTDAGPHFEQIVFGMITVFGRGNEIFFNFKNPNDKFRYPIAGDNPEDEPEVLGFFKEMDLKKIDPMKGPSPGLDSDESPLDLNVNDRSLVVMAFPHDSNIEFSPHGPGISLKQESARNFYRRLRHITFEAGIAVLSKEPKLGCKMICFHALEKSPTDGHGFNLHIEIVQRDGQQRLPLIIDPEVKHPGGNGGG